MRCAKIVHEVRESKFLQVLDRMSEVNTAVVPNVFGYVSRSSWGSRGEGFQYRSM